jgi:parallel beta-helix repeat protein
MLVQKKSYSCLLAGLIVVGGLLLGDVAFATDYFVDATSGSDSDSGLSEATAWKTVEKVSRSTFQPGDHVKFKSGEIYRGFSLLINGVSGTVTDPIVFESYGTGVLPVIDGSNDVTWVSLGANNIYSTEFTATGTNNENPFMLTVSGEAKPPVTTIQLNSLPPELKSKAVLIQESPFSSFWVKGTYSGNTVTGYDLAQNKIEEGGSLSLRYVDISTGKEQAFPETLDVTAVFASGAEAQAGLTENGDWYWDKENKTIYLFSDVDPSGTVEVNWEADGIRVDNSSYVQVKDIKVQNFNKQGVVLYLSSNITVDGVEIFACGKTGIQMWDSSNNYITNNSIDSVSGAISLWVLGSGTAENNQISNNTIANCFGACIGLTSAKVFNNTISENDISRANSMSYDGAGIYTFNAGSNLISSNTIHNCGSLHRRSAGIMVDVESGETTAAMTIVGNTISYNSTAGIAVSGASHRIHRNELVDNGQEFMDGRAQLQFFASGRPASYCTVTSNVITASKNLQFFIVEGGSNKGHHIDYNCYCGESSKQFSWAGEWMQFDTWRSKTGHDPNSVLNEAKPPTQPLRPPLTPPGVLQFIPAIIGACRS